MMLVLFVIGDESIFAHGRGFGCRLTRRLALQAARVLQAVSECTGQRPQFGSFEHDSTSWDRRGGLVSRQ